MEILGWSKPLVNPSRRGSRVGFAHLVVRATDGSPRARCGAHFDALTPLADAPPGTLDSVCLRCAAPYAKKPTARSLRAPKVRQKK